jgi:hypothetical protein
MALDGDPPKAAEGPPQIMADQAVTLGVWIAGTLFIFTSGSVFSVFGASLAFDCAFFDFFEPADYIRVAPIWVPAGGMIAAGLLLALVVRQLRGEKPEFTHAARDCVTEHTAHLESFRLEKSKRASRYAIATVSVLLVALGLAYWRMPLFQSSLRWLIILFTSLFVELIIDYVKFSPYYPRWTGARQVFLEIGPIAIAAAFTTGLLWLRPQVEDSTPVTFHLKSEKGNSSAAAGPTQNGAQLTTEKGCIIYVLNKFVIVWSKDGSHSVNAISTENIVKIDNLPKIHLLRHILSQRGK